MWGAEGPQQVKPHTARGVQEPLRTTKHDEILQLLLHLWLPLLPPLCTHIRTHTSKDRYIHTLTQSDESLLLLLKLSVSGEGRQAEWSCGPKGPQGKERKTQLWVSQACIYWAVTLNLLYLHCTLKLFYPDKLEAPVKDCFGKLLGKIKNINNSLCKSWNSKEQQLVFVHYLHVCEKIWDICFSAVGHTLSTCVSLTDRAPAGTEACFVLTKRDGEKGTPGTTTNDHRIKGKQFGLFSHSTGPEQKKRLNKINL